MKPYATEHCAGAYDGAMSPLPVLVGAARITQRARPGEGVDAVGLMTRAVEAALSDAASSRLRNRIGMVAVPRGMWRCADPGRAIASSIGAGEARTIVAEVGVLQHSLITAACEAIATGEIDAAVICGGEARYRHVQAGRAGIPIHEHDDSARPPDGILRPEGQVVSSYDVERGIVLPAVQYAMIGDAYAHAGRWSPTEHRARLGALWSLFADVAARDPHAWDRSAPDAETIVTPSENNRMVALPYTRLLCSQWNVDQAAALVLTSASVARDAGVPEDRFVFPVAGVESNAMIPMPQRAEIHRWPAFRIASERALDLAALRLGDVGSLELYSCFPSAVLVQMNELGLTADRSITVTGGMTFGGGPLNNFVLQATVAMAEQIRAGRETTGLVTGVSGLLTKPGVTVWSATAPESFQSDDVTEGALRETATRAIALEERGPATVIAGTVSYERDRAPRAIALVEGADGSRAVTSSQDGDEVDAFSNADSVGLQVELTGPGTFRVT